MTSLFLENEVPDVAGVFVASVIGLDGNGSSHGPIAPDPAGGDFLVPICEYPGQGSAVPAPRLEDLARSFDSYAVENVCDHEFGEELAEVGERLVSYLMAGCLSLPPCPGVDEDHMVVRLTHDNAIEELEPRVEYWLVPDWCSGGYRIDFAVDFPGEALVEVFYPADPGNQCCLKGCEVASGADAACPAGTVCTPLVVDTAPDDGLDGACVPEGY